MSNVLTNCCWVQTTALFSRESITTTHQKKKNLNSCKIPQPTPLLHTFKLHCYASRPTGDNESRTVLDAFFLGKALAEAINERVESSIGEVLSTIGRLQAEKQKQVQDFQEEVMEKAKRAKEKAAREAMEAQGIVPKSAMEVSSPASDRIKKSDNTSGLSSTTNAGSTTKSSSSPDLYKDVTTTNSDSDEETIQGSQA